MMERPKFQCKFCRETYEPILRSDVWYFEPHRITLGNACEGMVVALSDAITDEDRERLEAFLAETLPKIPPAGKKPTERQETANEDSIQLRFREFHKNNPRVMELLVERVTELKEKGRSRVSMSELWEWLRYDSPLSKKFVDATSKFSISNDYRSRYARALIVEYPHLAGLIEIRGLTAK